MSEALQAVTAAQVRLAEAEVALHDAVKAARDDRASWVQIGQALGITKQAAWERFGPYGRPPWRA